MGFMTVRKAHLGEAALSPILGETSRSWGGNGRSGEDQKQLSPYGLKGGRRTISAQDIFIFILKKECY